MKINTQSPLKVLALSIVFILHFSCSKDSDLLTDYVLTDAQEAIVGKYVVDDTFVVSLNGSVVLDVLSNDTFSEQASVIITETSEPTNGTAVINNDDTITYTPETTEATVDTFTYTTEVIVDETVSTETATVTVITEDPNKTNATTDLGKLKAFPTAEGYGRNATGGRGQNIYVVTNTNDSGAGSFRKAVDDADANNGGTVIFKTGGTVNLQSSIVIGSDNAENITIAGETAPGDGFGVRLSSTPTYGAAIEIRGSNTIMRHIRVHCDSDVHSSADGIRIHNQNAGVPYTLENVIVDHCSIYWTTDESIEVGSYGTGRTVRNVTIQNTLVAEPRDEGYGALMYRQRSTNSLISNITWYGMMFNDVNDRTPSGSSYDLKYEVINCIKYNVYKNIRVTYGNEVDYIGNIIKNNATNQPATGSTFKYAENTYQEAYVPGDGSVWEDDNLIVGDNTGNAYYNAAWTTYNNGSRVHTGSLITPMSSSLVSNFVSTNVGTKLWRSVTNDHDTRVINNYLNGTDTSNTSNLTYASGTPYKDADADNMWDVAEIAVFGSIGVTDNPIADNDGDGYTDIEETFFYFTGEYK